MTNKETINRRIGLSFDFMREIVDNPSMVETLETGTYINFVEKDFSMKESKKIKNTKFVKVINRFQIL